MTTSERLRKCVLEDQCVGIAHDAMKAAAELDQRDDTIAQLRVERDTMAAQIEGLKRGWNAEAKKCDDLKAERDRLRKIVEDFETLVGESAGVYGLHLNGDPSPWSEILQGGRFERIGDIEAALKGETK